MAEVIVVDNGSLDGSSEMVKTEFPGVKLVENGQNLGFGKANNVGVKQASGQLLLFLNSDAYAQSGSLETLVSVFEDEGVIAAGEIGRASCRERVSLVV